LKISLGRSKRSADEFGDEAGKENKSSRSISCLPLFLIPNFPLAKGGDRRCHVSRFVN
jgi:hypothetical protein